MEYRVEKLTDSEVDAEWSSIEALRLRHFMGEPPKHFPTTYFCLNYTATALHLMFRVEDDRCIRGHETEAQGRVWEDSCVEFFFTPSKDTLTGYFNLEINAIGTVLFQHQWRRGFDTRLVKPEHLAELKVQTSLEGPIPGELAGPLTWWAQVEVPISVLEAYSSVRPPRPGVVWMGNVYKCANKSSLPHWLSWAPVSRACPDFHVPECFGRLIFA